MQAGKLDCRIVILRYFELRSGDANDYNESVDAYAPIATVWASAVPVSDAERFRAGETLATRKYRFTVRYSSETSEIDPRDRLTFDGRTYDVNGVKEIGRREALEITATARAETP